MKRIKSLISGNPAGRLRGPGGAPGMFCLALFALFSCETYDSYKDSHRRLGACYFENGANVEIALKTETDGVATRAVPGARAKSFRVYKDPHGSRYTCLFGPFWGEDGKKFFYMNREMKGVDAASFRVILGNYARDKKYVYFRDKIVPDADPNKFHAYNADSGRTDRFIYHQTRKVKGVFHPPSFKQVRGRFWKDRSYVYYGKPRLVMGRLPGADPASVRVLNRYYAADKKSVYYMDRLVPGASPALARSIPGSYRETEETIRYGKIWIVRGKISKTKKPAKAAGRKKAPRKK